MLRAQGVLRAACPPRPRQEGTTFHRIHGLTSYTANPLSVKEIWDSLEPRGALHRLPTEKTPDLIPEAGIPAIYI